MQLAEQAEATQQGVVAMAVEPATLGQQGVQPVNVVAGPTGGEQGSEESNELLDLLKAKGVDPSLLEKVQKGFENPNHRTNKA